LEGGFPKLANQERSANRVFSIQVFFSAGQRTEDKTIPCPATIGPGYAYDIGALSCLHGRAFSVSRPAPIAVSRIPRTHRCARFVGDYWMGDEDDFRALCVFPRRKSLGGRLYQQVVVGQFGCSVYSVWGTAGPYLSGPPAYDLGQKAAE